MDLVPYLVDIVEIPDFDPTLPENENSISKMFKKSNYFESLEK